MFVVVCPHCRNTLQVDDQLAGRVIACPHCNGHVQAGVVVMPVKTEAPPAVDESNPLAFLDAPQQLPAVRNNPLAVRPHPSYQPPPASNPLSTLGHWFLWSGLSGIGLSCFAWLAGQDWNQLANNLFPGSGAMFLTVFVRLILPGLAGTATVAGAIMLGFGSVSNGRR